MYTIKYLTDGWWHMSKLKDRLHELVQMCFIKKSGQRRFSYFVVKRDKSHLIKSLRFYQKVLWNWYHQAAWFVIAYILLLTLLVHLSSPPVFSGVRSLVVCACFVDLCLSFCTFSFGHCVVCSSSIYGFWLPFWYFQTLPTCGYKLYQVSSEQRLNRYH